MHAAKEEAREPSFGDECQCCHDHSRSCFCLNGIACLRCVKILSAEMRFKLLMSEKRKRPRDDNEPGGGEEADAKEPKAKGKAKAKAKAKAKQ